MRLWLRVMSSRDGASMRPSPNGAGELIARAAAARGAGHERTASPCGEQWEGPAASTAKRPEAGRRNPTDTSRRSGRFATPPRNCARVTARRREGARGKGRQKADSAEDERARGNSDRAPPPLSVPERRGFPPSGTASSSPPHLACGPSSSYPFLFFLLSSSPPSSPPPSRFSPSPLLSSFFQLLPRPTPLPSSSPPPSCLPSPRFPVLPRAGAGPPARRATLPPPGAARPADRAPTATSRRLPSARLARLLYPVAIVTGWFARGLSTRPPSPAHRGRLDPIPRDLPFPSSSPLSPLPHERSASS